MVMNIDRPASFKPICLHDLSANTKAQAEIDRQRSEFLRQGKKPSDPPRPTCAIPPSQKPLADSIAMRKQKEKREAEGSYVWFTQKEIYALYVKHGLDIMELARRTKIFHKTLMSGLRGKNTSIPKARAERIEFAVRQMVSEVSP